jgi:hypothetical protein
MDPSRADRILEDWAAVAGTARRPAIPPRVTVTSGLSSATLAGATLVVAAVAIAVLWLGGRGPSGSVGGDSSASPDRTSAPVETPTPVPTMGPCDPVNLAARITLWEGAAGHRIADVELTNVGSAPCTLMTMARPQLVDGRGTLLIDGSSPTTTDLLTVGPGDVLTTLVQDGNYCGPAPVAPVTVAFDLGDGSRIVATPFSSSDTTGVPPCLGSGSPATIEMQPWTR